MPITTPAPSATEAESGLPPKRQRVRRGNADDAERMRTDLLQAAMNLFEQGGVEAVSVRGVAARVGVSAMAPYRYFANRADLLNGLWQQVMELLYTHLQEAIDGIDRPLERHRAFIRGYFDFWEPRRNEFRLVYETQGLQMLNESVAHGDTSALKAIVELGRDVSTRVALALNQSTAHVALASELRVALMFGYMQARMVNRRYPWSDMQALKETCIEQIACAAERVLADGAPAGS